VYGNAQTVHGSEGLLGILHELIPMFEPAYADQWASLSDPYRERMLSHIVGFEIAVTKIEVKFKLSQNRMKDEQQKIIDSLSLASDTAITGTAALMREQGLGLKKDN
jgi:transcriptional regulator